MIAAKMGGADTIIFPKENERELAKIPDVIKKGLKLHPVSHADEVLRIALDIDKPENFMKDELKMRAEATVKKGQIPPREKMRHKGGEGDGEIPGVPQ